VAHVQDERPDEISARAWLERLEDVREHRDRNASLPLLSLLLRGDLDDDDRHSVAATLALLEDQRCLDALERAVLDPGVDPAIRLPALGVLTSIPRETPPVERRRAWARSDDELTRAYALEFADVLDIGHITNAARDPSPLVRRFAIEALGTLARTPELVRAADAALRDPDAVVREAACRVAYFDEPLALSRGLLRLLQDDDEQVRGAAHDALEDYPQVAVMLALADARGAGAEAEQARFTLEHLVREVARVYAQAGPAARLRVERWVAPARWLVGEVVDLWDIPAASELPDDCPWLQTGCDHEEWVTLVDSVLTDEDVPETDQTDQTEQTRALVPCDLDRALDVLLDDCASPLVQRECLVERSWRHTGDVGLSLLRQCARSPDWGIRLGTVFALAECGARDDLLDVIADPEPVVVRAALSQLRILGDRRAVHLALAVLEDDLFRGTAGDDALRLVATLGSPAQIEHALLRELARADDRDGLFLGAVTLVRELRVRKAIPSLLALVASPIIGSVRVHVDALRTLRELGHDPALIHLQHLQDVDHLHLQAELGEWGWRGGRYA
jgi:HEAT repeat protein